LQVFLEVADLKNFRKPTSFPTFREYPIDPNPETALLTNPTFPGYRRKTS